MKPEKTMPMSEHRSDHTGDMLLPLANRRVLVTGGTSGIGREVVMLAARQGADVAFCGLEPDLAQQVAADVAALGRRAYSEAFDISDLERTRSFTRAAIADLGGLDGLVNNAGTNFLLGVLEASQADIERCFAVDFYPAWAVSQEAHKALKASRGVVVTIASIHARHTTPGSFPYNAAKAALVALTQSLALEWAPDGIRSLAIAPALILTPLAAEYFRGFADPAAERARLEAHYPGGRAGTPADVAALVTFLLSGTSSFLTGELIKVDGGISALLESSER